MRFKYCLGSENGTQSLLAADFVLAGSSRGGAEMRKTILAKKQVIQVGINCLGFSTKSTRKQCVNRRSALNPHWSRFDR